MTIRQARAFGRVLTAGTLALALAPIAAAAPPAGGYWLSAELEGSPGHRVQAATEMTGDAERVFPLDPAANLPGEPIARVASIQEAMAWVARWSFDGRALGIPEAGYALREVPAPAPGGSLESRHQLLVRSLVVTGATPDDGVRDIQWPLSQRSVLPKDSEWSPAALVPELAPVFAAPAPFVPPAAERSGQARRSGGLYLLGHLDRCADTLQGRHCMRWAQVVARDGDRFVPGYLPAYQVAPLDAWVRAESNLPRAQLIPAVVDDDTASALLLARLVDNRLHTQMLQFPTRDGGFPAATLEIDATSATVRVDGQPPLKVELTPEMDRRPPAGPATTPG